MLKESAKIVGNFSSFYIYVWMPTLANTTAFVMYMSGEGPIKA